MAMLNKKFPDRKDSFVLYGENLKRTRDAVKSFRDIPKYNMIMTCLSQFEKDENGRRFAGFQMAGRIADELPQYFDEVFYVNVAKDGARSLLTSATDTNPFPKDRSRRLAPQEAADLTLIWQKIYKPTEEKTK
jgi:hypothetical protein